MHVSARGRSLGRRIVKVVASGVDRVSRRERGVVVLAYHRVGGGATIETDLPAALFEEQMATLASTAQVLPLGTALERLSQPASESEAIGRLSQPVSESEAIGVVLTFDDGTADFADVVLPIIARYKLPVTLFVATSFVEEQRRFPHDGVPLSWSALADACATGLVDVGSHTHRHRLLDRLPAGEIVGELDRSTALIGDRLGRRADDFAYPKAVLGSALAERAVRQRFRSAALAGTRPNVVGRTDPHRLARSPIQTADGMTWFRKKMAGGMALEDRLRRVTNRWRYANTDT